MLDKWYHEIICDEDTIVYRKKKEQTNKKQMIPIILPIKTYYITNDYKLIKYVHKTVITDDNKSINKDYSTQCISRSVEIDYQEFNNVIYPVRMNVVWAKKHYKNKDEFCLIKKDITEYYMKKIEKTNISEYSNNNKFIDIYKIPITKEFSDYEDYIIYDNLRERVMEDLENDK